MSEVPSLRLRTIHETEANVDGDYVLYWMIAFRRTEWNFSLQRAVEWARQLRKPLLVFEPLRSGYRWASDRFHQFVIQGMADNAQRFKSKNVFYFPYIEPRHGMGKGLLAALARRACVVISDDFPSFFLPGMVRSAAEQITARFELVDSNGILPMRAADKVFARAHDFRRFLQKNVRSHLVDFPRADPLKGWRLPKLDRLPAVISRRWSPAQPSELSGSQNYLADLPIDHSVTAAKSTSGGSKAAQKQLREFLSAKLSKYNSERNQPQQEVTSGLSAYLHFGHISAHQVFCELVEHDGWNPGMLADKASGSASDWWGASPPVESFLDQLITWREVGYNMCSQREDYAQYESLPEWSLKTLAEHASDPRDHIYTLEEFEAADTHDELWNAAQRQLVREGRIHNYLRMVWGKKILEWSVSPRQALEVLVELNNKYALDGRDPNSYSGLFWCLGRYDRAWGPVRPIFGKVRYMSSQNTARKLRVKGYLEKYSPDS